MVQSSDWYTPDRIGPSMPATMTPDDLSGVIAIAPLDSHRAIWDALGVTNDESLHLRLVGLVRDPQRSGAPELMYRGILRLKAQVLLARSSTAEALRFVEVMDAYRPPTDPAA